MEDRHSTEEGISVVVICPEMTGWGGPGVSDLFNKLEIFIFLTI